MIFSSRRFWIRVVADHDASDIEYVGLIDWLKIRFKKSKYIRNVECAHEEGLTYEPLLYRDDYLYDYRDVPIGIHNQQLPRLNFP